MKSCKWLVLVAVMLAGVVPAFAQSAPNLANGFTPYGSFDEHQIGAVNLMNGNLVTHVSHPQHYPQRGGRLNNDFVLALNAKTWTVQSYTSPDNCCPPVYYWTSNPGWGPLSMSSGATVLPSATRTYEIDVDPAGNTTYSDYGYHVSTWDGGVDPADWNIAPGNPDANGTPQGGTIFDPDGNQYTIASWAGPCHTTTNDGLNGNTMTTLCNQLAHATVARDTNGNIFGLPNSSPFTDTLGRTFGAFPSSGSINSTSDYSGCVSPLPIASANLNTYPGPNGVTNQIKVCYSTLQLQTNFGISGTLEFPNRYSGSANVSAPMTMILPDGTKWVFQYDSYGNLTSIGLPLGGSVSYQWETVAFPPVPDSNITVSRAVSSRTVNDNNGNSSTWTYHWMTQQTTGSSGAVTSYTNVVTDPLGNDAVHVFTNLGSAYYETSTLYYQGSSGSGQLLKRVDTAYQVDCVSGIAAPNVCSAATPPTYDLPISIQTTVYPSGEVSKVTKSYDTAGLGKVVAEKDYDWGQGTPGALLRETDTTYEWQANSAYLNANLLDLPASVVVKDGNGNRVAETDYTYDESAYLTASNITTQHGAAPNTVRGNLTTVSKWLNTSTSPVVSHTNWYDTGEVYQQIDPLGNTTTHSYDPAYAGAYSTKTCNALSECVSGAYDFNTGLLTSLTDANGNTSSYSYDLMSRMTLAQLPADPSGNRPQTTFTYSPANSFPVTVQRQKTITSSLTHSVTTYLDGLGRPYETQHATPNGNATVVTTYDAAGRVASTTNPYFTTSDPTYGVTQSQYDGLGRVTQTIKQDGSVTAAAYEQTAGVSTNADCTITADEADKQRKTCTDGLGRLIEVNEPQASSVGTSATASVTISGTLNSAPSTDLLPAAGTSLTSYVAADGTPRVVYLGANQHVYQLAWSSGGGWQGQDLTALTGTPLAGSSSGLAAIVNAGGCPHLEYVDMNQHVNDLYLPNTSGGCLTNWANEDLTALSGNTLASDASPLAISGAGGDSLMNIYYVDSNRHANRLYWPRSGGFQNQDLTAAAAGPTVGSGSGLAAIVNAGGCPHLEYVDMNQHVNDLYLPNTSGGCLTNWANEDLTAQAGNTLAAVGSPLAITGAGGDSLMNIYYLDSNRHVNRLYWPKSGGFQNQDLTAAAAGPTVGSGSGLAAIVNSGGCPHFEYVDVNQHVNDLYLPNTSGGCLTNWANEDLTAQAGNTLAEAGSPVAIIGAAGDGLMDVFYMDSNHYLNRLYWLVSGGFTNQDLTLAGSLVADAGTVSTTVGSFTATACYGTSTNAACNGQPVNNTAAQVAAVLAQSLNSSSSPVSATVSGSTISMTWITPGPFTPAVSALSTAHDNPGLFPNPSFTSPATNFSGGTGGTLSNPYVTLYTYDVLGNLLSVNQKGDGSQAARVRTFTYDSLSRLLTATNPESGQISRRESES